MIGSSTEAAALSSSLPRKAFVSLAMKVANQVLMLGVMIVLARLMGSEDFGYYVYALSALQVAALFAKLGTDAALLKHLPVYLAGARWDLARGLLVAGHLWVLALAVLTATIAAAFVHAFGGRSSPELVRTLCAACIVLPVFASAEVSKAALGAMLDVARAELPERIARPLLITVAASATWLATDELSGATAMMINGFAWLVCAAILATWMARTLRAQPGYARCTARIAPGPWMRSAFPLMLVAAATLTNTHADVLMLGSLLGPREAGIYKIASNLAGVTLFGLASVSFASAGMLSGLHARNDLPGMQRVLSTASRSLIATTAPMAVGLVLAGTVALRVFGEEFAVGRAALTVLVVGNTINALSGPVGWALIASGRARLVAVGYAATAAANIALNAVLIPRHGLLGAALATAASSIGINLALSVVLVRALGLHASPLALLPRIRHAHFSAAQ